MSRYTNLEVNMTEDELTLLDQAVEQSGVTRDHYICDVLWLNLYNELENKLKETSQSLESLVQPTLEVLNLVCEVRGISPELLRRVNSLLQSFKQIEESLWVQDYMEGEY
jgi:uncharacterized coiled-coil DUF342 family protein